MISTRKKTLAALSALHSATRRTAAKQPPGEGLPPEKLQDYIDALETAARCFAAMSDTTFQLHLELADEDDKPRRYITRHAARFAAAILILLLSLAPGFAQTKYDSPLEALAAIHPEQCTCIDLLSYKLLPNRAGKTFPNIYRSDLPAAVFAENSTNPFLILYAEHFTDPPTLVHRGACRNYTVTVPMHAPGFYFVLFPNPPISIIAIDAANYLPEIQIKQLGKCVLEGEKGGEGK